MKPKTVLLVDDDRLVREAVGDFLHEQGYQVRVAPDGLEALQAVRADPPDFLVLDLVMPKVDGGRLCRYLREDSRLRHIPIVVFSALAARDIGGMPEVSADAYVAKGPLPIVTKNLLAALQHLERAGRSAPLAEAVFGYEGFRPRRLVSELLSLRRHVDVLLRSLSEGVLETDREDRICYVNPSALRMVESGEQTLIGAKLWDVFGPTCRETVQRTTEKLRTDPEAESHTLTVDLPGRLLAASFTPVWEHDDYTGLLVLLEILGPRNGPQATSVPQPGLQTDTS
ncbi:MAG: response regulator [Candidatus Methylomirabilota bacterium]